jgi:hypothetical protein
MPKSAKRLSDNIVLQLNERYTGLIFGAFPARRIWELRLNQNTPDILFDESVWLASRVKSASSDDQARAEKHPPGPMYSYFFFLAFFFDFFAFFAIASSLRFEVKRHTSTLFGSPANNVM